MFTTLHPSPVGDLLVRADSDGRLVELFTRHDGAAET
jgi:methylated-DNA-[protein]-cysteine S-methyltransferase